MKRKKDIQKSIIRKALKLSRKLQAQASKSLDLMARTIKVMEDLGDPEDSDFPRPRPPKGPDSEKQ